MNYTPAGFWIRLLAAIVDAIILGVIQGIVQVIGSLVIVALGQNNSGSAIGIFIVMTVINIAISVFYIGWFYSKKGGTPGKLAFGMKVLNNETGEYLTFGRALLRDILGKLVSAIILFIGFLMVAFRSDKRGLHDLIAGTCVIKS